MNKKKFRVTNLQPRDKYNYRKSTWFRELRSISKNRYAFFILQSKPYLNNRSEMDVKYADFS